MSTLANHHIISLPKQRQYHQPEDDNKHRNDEHDKRNTVHAMHIFHPLRTGLIWIPLLDV
jgi:hypothetical protein